MKKTTGKRPAAKKGSVAKKATRKRGISKANVKRLFVAIEEDDPETLGDVLDAHPEALETVGEHNRLVRDKTPLMYALQNRNLPLAGHLLDRGADATAIMPGGPMSCVLSLAVKFAYSDPDLFPNWIPFVERLLDEGAGPTDGLWTSVARHGDNGNTRLDLIRLLLDRGGNPDRRPNLVSPTATQSTIRTLVKINRAKHPPELLAMFDIEPDDEMASDAENE